ncbi:MAG: hypothetical protein QM775_29220 [Pirellulales bacterium]
MRPRVEAWRKEYAYQSLADRLDYERSYRNADAPALSKASQDVLVNEEEREDWAFNTVRAQSLRLLHEESVFMFVSREGNGFQRMPPIGPAYVEPWGSQDPVLPARVFDVTSTGDSSSTQSLPLPDDRAKDEANAPNPNARDSSLPSARQANELHAFARARFLDPSLFGHVAGERRSAGFVPHSFTWRFDPSHVVPFVWKMTRLELVSLLKHSEPRVYLSQYLPRMQELSSAKTRSLDTFEASALERLRNGEELETAATPNRIAMLGAVRASNTCLKCHSLPRGTLLGAFSYELRRDPPLKIRTPSQSAAMQ